MIVRRGHREAEEEGGRLAIPITVRQVGDMVIGQTLYFLIVFNTIDDFAFLIKIT